MGCDERRREGNAWLYILLGFNGRALCCLCVNMQCWMGHARHMQADKHTDISRQAVRQASSTFLPATTLLLPLAIARQANQ